MKMNYKLSQILDAYKDQKNYPTVESICLKFKLKKRALNRLIKKAIESGEQIDMRKGGSGVTKNEQISFQEENKFQREIVVLRQNIQALKSRLEIAHHEQATNERLINLIHEAKSVSFQNDKDWLDYKNGKGNHANTPVLFLSDIHFDEVVEPAHIEYVNEYNHDICVQRLKNCFNRTIEILKIKMTGFKYNGIVLALGGDIVSGNIHEELAETNDATILQTIVSAVQIIGDGIGELADVFGKVYVPCVVGNHGRIHKKPRFKYRVQQNYEWLIYQLLAKRFISDKRITFDIPESTDITFKVANTTFLLTHGDQFKGGNGISGIFTPIMLGMSKKLKRQSALHRAFDVMMIGHFHQLIMTNSLIINGSCKGFDEFSAGMNFSYEEPQQALFLVHPEHGMTIRIPVKCK